LTKPGPVSYGYPSFGFEDIMFVDVGVYLNNGGRSMNRTLVIKDRDGKWYVHPDPFASPLLERGTQRRKCVVSGIQRRPQPRELRDLWEASKHMPMRNQEALPAFAERPGTTSTRSAGSAADM